MQRTGRSGHAHFRVIVQYSHFHPTRGKVVAYLGSYNPHSKEITLDKDLASKYLKNGAQPSDRVAKLLKKEGVKLPDWVSISPPKKRVSKNPEKLRKNRPAEPAKPEPAPAEPEAPAATSEEPEPQTSPEAEAGADEAEAPTEEPEAQVEIEEKVETQKPVEVDATETPAEEAATPVTQPKAPAKK